MKKNIVAVVIFLCSLCASNSLAQEFKLKINLSVNGTPWPNPIYVGYDVSASDEFEFNHWISPEYSHGEDMVAPDSFNDIDFRVVGDVIKRSNLGTGGYTDIRNRPVADSSQLLYAISVRAKNKATARLSWDPSQIPAIVKHLYLSSAIFPTRFRLDMKTTSSFDLPLKDSSGLYNDPSFIILSLLYNKETLGVHTQVDDNLPMLLSTVIEQGKGLKLLSDKDMTVAVSIYDLLGRSLRHISISTAEGLTQLPVSFTSILPQGTYLLELTSADHQTSRQKFIIQ